MLLNTIKQNITNFKDNLAFYIEDQSYLYKDFKEKITGIQQELIRKNISKNDFVIVHTYNDLETYATILAVWFSGATFVPINPKHPKERNERILTQIPVSLQISSNQNDKNCLYTKGLQANTKIINQSFSEQILYILFTSGSTGTPKGVPISHKNLDAFIGNFNAEFNLNNTDKFLQIYDLTFDASVHCYVLPLFLGASIFTVSPNKIKYLEAYKLLEKHQLTFAKFPPSVLVYLKPFFNRITLPKLRYSLLGGESLPENLAKAWQKCLPNGEIYNVYGPTEATINTHIFNFTKKYTPNKNYNGIVAIGKTFGTNKAFVIDQNNIIVGKNSKGELCLLGNQITNGYFKNVKKNKQAFFIKNQQQVYKTGDLVLQDKDGDYLYCGRIDNQIQIQGYRVELSEIEQIARKFNQQNNIAVISKKNKFNIAEIYVFTEKLSVETSDLHQFLQNNLPNYMLPAKIVNLDKFPLTAGGKIDYNTLKKHV